jgi:hypothetical protein
VLLNLGDPSVVQPSQARVSLLRDDTRFCVILGEEAASRIVISILPGSILAGSPLLRPDQNNPVIPNPTTMYS